MKISETSNFGTWRFIVLIAKLIARERCFRSLAISSVPEDFEKKNVHSTNLSIMMMVSIVLLIVIVPPTRGLALRVAQRALVLILHPSVEYSLRPVPKLRLGALIARPHTPVRSITGAVVPERSIQDGRLLRSSKRRGREYCHGRGWLCSGCSCVKRRGREVGKGEDGGCSWCHVYVVQICVFVLARVQKVWRRDDDLGSVLALSSAGFEGLDSSEESFGAVPESFGAGPSESGAGILVVFPVARQLDHWLAGYCQSMDKKSAGCEI